MGSGIKGDWTVAKRDDGTGGHIEAACTIKAKRLVIEESADLPGIVVDQHSHDASAIISGVIDQERLPENLSMRAVKKIAGDGETNSFALTHSLGVKEVAVTVFDNDGVKVEVGYVCQSTGNILVNFAVPPADGEEYSVLIQR